MHDHFADFFSELPFHQRVFGFSQDRLADWPENRKAVVFEVFRVWCDQNELEGVPGIGGRYEKNQRAEAREILFIFGRGRLRFFQQAFECRLCGGWNAGRGVVHQGAEEPEIGR